MANLNESIETGISLVGMRNCLTLVQTAYAIALEGVTRATATQIANKETNEYDSPITPSNVGQAFATFGIKTVTSHGKTRFVLDIRQLEKLREAAVAQCEEMAQKLEASLESYKELDARVEALVERLKEVYQLTNEEQEIKRLIGEAE